MRLEAIQQLDLEAAVQAQRRYWRRVRPADVDVFDFSSLSEAATYIAEALDGHFREVRSHSWKMWCQSSITAGGGKLIKWILPSRASRAGPVPGGTTYEAWAHRE